MKKTAVIHQAATLEDQIFIRYSGICSEHGIPQEDRLSIGMTLHFAGKDIPSLDLQKLADSNDENFGHDIFGLLRHINRRTCKVENCFLPRCAR